MQCPKCGTDLPEGALLCEKCGEEIHIVPDYDPTLDISIDVPEAEIKQTTDEDLSPKEDSRPTKVYALRLLLVILGIVVLGLAVAVSVNLRRLESADYQISQAKKFQVMGEYDRAIECYAKAIELEEDDVALLLQLAEIYYQKNDQIRYEETLQRILSHKDANEDQISCAMERMIPILVQKGDFDKINRLLGQFPIEKLLNENKEYLAPKPSFSMEEGTYFGIQSLSILSEADGTLYYTLDGTIPGETSEIYTMPIVLDLGEVTVKACLINEYGVKSEIIESKFTIVAPEPKEEK